MDIALETTDRVIAAITTQATTSLLPENVETLLLAFCAMLEPAEA
jgi:hypothetical protein